MQNSDTDFTLCDADGCIDTTHFSMDKIPFIRTLIMCLSSVNVMYCHVLPQSTRHKEEHSLIFSHTLNVPHVSSCYMVFDNSCSIGHSFTNARIFQNEPSANMLFAQL